MRTGFKNLCFLVAIVCAPLWHAAAQSAYRGMNVNSFMSAEDATELIETLDVNMVVYQMAWGVPADTATEEEYFAWLDTALDNLDTLLPIYDAANVKVIVSLNTSPGGFYDRYAARPQVRAFKEAWAQEALIEVWDIIGERYKDDSRIYGYYLLSEPAVGASIDPGLMDWPALAYQAALAVRAHDSEKKLVITAPYAAAQSLMRIKNLRGIPNVLFGLHMYYPHDFLHQGILGYPFNIEYPTKQRTLAKIKKHLVKARQFQRRYRVPIIVAEMSVIRYAPADSAARYLQDVLTLFEKYKWDWAYHIWREADVWSIEHGSDPDDSSPSPTETSRATVLKSFYSRNNS